MAAVQFDNGVEVLLAVSAPRPEAKVSAVRRRAPRLYAIGRHEVVAAAPSAAEPEDHWDDGARASLAMVGFSYRG